LLFSIHRGFRVQKEKGFREKRVQEEEGSRIIKKMFPEP
jgi:hypothetical protein